MKADQHVHTHHSFDGQSNALQLGKAAMANGISYLCVTEHFSVCDYDPSFYHLDDGLYADEIKSAQATLGDGIVLSKGIEISEPHVQQQDILAWMAGKHFDMVIGSVHNIGQHTLRKHKETHDACESYGDYFQEILRMVTMGDMDVVGHLDLMKRYAFDRHGNYATQVWQDILCEIMSIMISRGVAMEINSSGLRHDAAEMYPRLDILRMYQSLGGERITFGSDAHRADDVGQNLEKAVKMAKACGFRWFCVYENRHPRMIPLDQWGADDAG